MQLMPSDTTSSNPSDSYKAPENSARGNDSLDYE
jgi:hypothetical protein